MFTYKLSYVPLFPGYKVSNDDGLSMVSAVRTFTLVRKVPYPILLALHILLRGSPGNKEVLISVSYRAPYQLAGQVIDVEIVLEGGNARYSARWLH